MRFLVTSEPSFIAPLLCMPPTRAGVRKMKASTSHVGAFAFLKRPQNYTTLLGVSNALRKWRHHAVLARWGIVGCSWISSCSPEGATKSRHLGEPFYCRYFVPTLRLWPFVYNVSHRVFWKRRWGELCGDRAISQRFVAFFPIRQSANTLFLCALFYAL